MDPLVPDGQGGLTRAVFVVAAALLTVLLCAACGGGSETSTIAKAKQGEITKPREPVETPAERRKEARENRAYEHQIERERQQALKRSARKKEKQAARRDKQEEAAAKRKTEREAEAEEKEASSGGGAVKAQNREGGACGHFPTSPHPFRQACEDSYSVCEVEAPTIVERAYHEEGGDWQEWAYKYSRETYAGGSDQFVQNLIEEASFEGCLGAMYAEYERLYR